LAATSCRCAGCRWRSLLPWLLAVGVLAGGCSRAPSQSVGRSTPSSDVSSGQALDTGYLAQVEDICATAGARIADVIFNVYASAPPTQTLPAAAAKDAADQIAGFVRAEVAQARSVTPPPQDRAILEDIFAETERAASALQSDPQKVGTVGLTTSEDPFRHAEELARRYGFGSCPIPYLGD
jgi:hypothetical protein